MDDVGALAERILSSASASAPPEVVLGLPVGSSRDDVRAAYRRLVLLLHPDKASGVHANAGAAFAAVAEAYSTALRGLPAGRPGDEVGRCASAAAHAACTC